MIANAMQTTNVMNGVHSIDLGVLALPIIMEMVMLIADTEGVDYVTGTERDIESEVSGSSIEVATEKATGETPITEPDMMEEEQTEETMPTGLMARRV